MNKNKKKVVTGIVAAYSVLTSALFPVNGLAATPDYTTQAGYSTQAMTTPEDIVRRSIGLPETKNLSSLQNNAQSSAVQTMGTIMGSNSIMRIAGRDRYETAAKIAQGGWKNTSEYAVISAGMDQNLVDALTVVPLAKAKNAPILLTEGDSLNSYTRSELTRLKVKTVYVTSGKGVITQNVLNELKAMGIEVKELGGIDRFQTAINIAKELGARDKLIIATAFTNADALSIGSIAATKGIPILLSAPDQLPDNVAKYLDEIHGDITQTYVIGGEGALSQTVKDALPNPMRIGGKDRYETNIEILKAFASDINYSKSYVASGEDAHMVDAIAGSPLAALSQSPILLADDYLSPSTKAFAESNLSPQTIAFGGEAVVPGDTLEQLVSAKVYSDDNIMLGSEDVTNPLKLQERISVVGENVAISNINTAYSMYIQSGKISLKNINVDGTLFIDTNDVGDVNLENVKADNIVVLSSEKNASIQSVGKARIAAAPQGAGIHMKNVKSNSLVVDSQSNIDTSGLTQIINTLIRSTAVVNVIEGSLGQVQLGGSTTDIPPTVELKGKIDFVIVTAQVNVVSTSANIEKLVVQPIQQDAKISLQGNFNTLEVTRPGQVRLGANTKITNTIVNSSAVLDATNGSFGKVEVAKASPAASETVVLFKGTFNDTITVSGQATIKKDENATLTKIEVQVVIKDQKVTFEGSFKPTEVIEVIKGKNAVADANLSINVPEGSSADTVVDKSGISTSQGGGTVNGEETSTTPISTPPAETTTPAPGPGGGDTTPAVTVDTVTITTSDLFVPEGEPSYQLTAEVRLSNGTLDTSGVSWELTNPATMSQFATIDTNGLVTALKHGTVTIKATSKKDTTKSTTVNLTVEEVPEVKDGTATFSNGTSIIGLPAGLKVSASEVIIISDPASGIQAVGKIMDFSSSGDLPAEGIVLEIPVNIGTTDAGLSTFNTTTGEWELVPESVLDIENNVVRATLHHFSRYGALKVTPQIVANGITSLTAPSRDATALALPSVPTGFEISIETSSNEAVIAKNGIIIPPEVATEVTLMFTVKKTSDGTTADTKSITVTVPAKSDKTAPVVTGVEDGKTYTTTVVPTFSEGTAKLDGVDYASGTEITAEGSHVLVVTDSAGNATSIHFIIDTIAPVVTGIENGKVYNSTVKPTFNEGTAKLDGVDYVSGTEIVTEGSRELVVTDPAGNKTIVQFSIDMAAPNVLSASATIGGQTVNAVPQTDGSWKVNLVNQADSALFTDMDITADLDAQNAVMSFSTKDDTTITKTITFISGKANINIHDLLGVLDGGAPGISVGAIKELGITNFNATIYDVIGNHREIQIQLDFAPDATAPTISETSASGTTHTGSALNFTSNEAGTYYYLVYGATEAAPDVATIKAQGAAVAKGSAAIVSGPNTVNVNGLAPLTAYKAYVIVVDASNNTSEVKIIDITTIEAPDTTAPNVLAASATIGGQTVNAILKEDGWYVDLSKQPDTALFTFMTINATTDTAEALMTLPLDGGVTVTKTIAFTNGVAEVDIPKLLGGLDTDEPGLALGNLRKFGMTTFTAQLKDLNGNTSDVVIKVETQFDITPPQVQSAKALIGGAEISAQGQGDQWTVDLSNQPDSAMFTDLEISADVDASSIKMSAMTQNGTTATKTFGFTDGIAKLNIHELLGSLDSGEEGILVATIKNLGIRSFTAEIMDASGNIRIVNIELKVKEKDQIAPQIQSAKALISGVEVLAQGQGNQWTVDLSGQPDSAMFTGITIEADSDAAEGSISCEYNGTIITQTVTFTDGVANVNIKNLLGELDTGAEGVSVGKLRELGIKTFTATLTDSNNNISFISIQVNTTVIVTEGPQIISAKALIGGEEVLAQGHGSQWAVDLSDQPDNAMLTDMTIEADPEATSMLMSATTQNGTKVSKLVGFTNGIAEVNIHQLLGSFDSGADGLSVASIRNLGITNFTAELMDASGNTTPVRIDLKVTALDQLAPQLISAKALIGGKEVLAHGQGNEWTVDLSSQLDSAMFTNMTIEANSDTTEGSLSCEYNGTIITQTTTFTNGVANVNIKDLLGDLDNGAAGVSVGKLRELGISTFTASLKDADNNQTIITIRVNTTAQSTEAPQVISAKALIGGNDVVAQGQGTQWTVDLSGQPGTAMFTDMTIVTDPDATSILLSATTTENGATLSKTLDVINGIAQVNISELLGSLDSGEEGLSVATIRNSGITRFTAKIMDANGNTTIAEIELIVPEVVNVFPQVHSAHAMIDGQEIVAQQQDNGTWLVDLASLPNEAMFTDMVIQADPDTTTATMACHLAGDLMINQTIYFIDGVSALKISVLLGDLDSGTPGVSIAKLREIGMTSFTAELQDSNDNSTLIRIDVNL